MSLRAVRTRIVKDPDHGGVAPFQHADYAAHTAAIGFRWLDLNQHLVALHGAVDLIRGNKNIFLEQFRPGSLAWVGPHKSVAVAMQVESSGSQVIPCSNRLGNAPVFAVQLDQFAAHGQPGQLLQQQAPLAPSAQAQLADKLLVSSLLPCGADDPRHQFTIGHKLRVGHRLAGVECRYATPRRGGHGIRFPFARPPDCFAHWLQIALV